MSEHLPSRIQRAFQTISEACAELSVLRRKGNFLRSTIARVDGEDANVCEALGTIRGFVDDLHAENRALQATTLARLPEDEEEVFPADTTDYESRTMLDALASRENLSFEELYGRAMQQTDPGAWIAERAEEHGLDGEELHELFDAEMKRRGDAEDTEESEESDERDGPTCTACGRG